MTRYNTGWVPLPGDDFHWPTQVSVNDKPLAVISKNRQPGIILDAGNYRLQGHINWEALPRALTLPTAGLIEASILGKPLQTIERDGAALVLQTNRTPSTKPDSDALDVQVFRLLDDSIPMTLTSRLILNVSGAERQVRLGQLLPESFIPQRLDSALPARLEPDGEVTVQLRPGRWQLTLVAHTFSSPASLGMKASSDRWPSREIWAFSPQPELRSVELAGAPAIDPQQTELPAEWRNYPVFMLTTDSQLTLTELARGNDRSQYDLSINKHLWLDFDGEGFTVEDRIYGDMGKLQRLDTLPILALGSAELNGDAQLITHNGDPAINGFEVRPRQVEIQALSRMPRSQSLPASGWNADFSQATTRISLPPGWSALWSGGADDTRGTWLARWSLWDIFLVLVISAAFTRLGHWSTGVLAFATLVLIYHRLNAPVWLWLNLAVALAACRIAWGRFEALSRYYLLASFGALVLIYLPFAVQQARQMIYPQLEPVTAYSTPASARQEVLAEADMADRAAPLMSSMDISERLQKTAPATPPKKEAYIPSQPVQTGPGRPDWRWREIQLNWSGPVKPDQTGSVTLAPPLANRLGNLFALIAPLLLGLVLWRRARPFDSVFPAGFKHTALPLVICLLLVPTGESEADVLVDQALLDALQQRLTEPAKCLPECAAIESAQVMLVEGQLTVTLDVSAGEELAYPLPMINLANWPRQITQNNQRPVLAKPDQQLLVSLPAGRHRLVLTGPVPRQDLDLVFASTLHNLEVDIADWSISGLPRPRQNSQHLQLTPPAAVSTEAAPTLTPATMPTLVRVTRHLVLGVSWQVQTRVERVAPQTGSVSLLIPLLSGEAPLSGNPDGSGAMRVELAPNQHQIQWSSRLDERASITLTAPTEVPWTERWTMDVLPLWHVDIEGLAALRTEQNNNLWLPRPGETLTLAISRPEAVPGKTLTLSSVSVNVSAGTRAENTTLNLTLKSNQGGFYDLALPEHAELSGLTIDGRERPISYAAGKLRIPLAPGSQHAQLQWQTPSALGTRTRTPAIDFGLEASNLSLGIDLPRDRWVLLVGGPSLGPAILFWGALLVTLVIVIALARSRLTPLKLWEWVLLSLGLATLNIYLLIIIALWFIALSWRGKQPGIIYRESFQAIQAGLLTLSLATIFLLISAIPYSLLAQPDMLVTGYQSHAHSLHWFSDRTQALLPEAWVISLPLWAYRLAMLLWSLWLAFALTRWLPWAWKQLSAYSFWERPKADNNEKLDLELPKDA